MSGWKFDRAALPAGVLELLERLRSGGHKGWVVGGCVRDHLLGRRVSDWDVCTTAKPEEVVALFPRTIPTGIAHGTVTVLLHKVGYEVTTLRGEQGYSDGRRPDRVEFVLELREDLARRDFTVNAIAYDALENRLEDPFDGLGDLSRRVLRAVGDAQERFSEDGLRVLRAARFVAALEFALDPATEAAIEPNLPTFQKVSRERVHDEWHKSMKARAPSAAFAVMKRTGLLAAICPPLEALEEGSFQRALGRLDAVPVGDPALRLGGLLCGLDPVLLDAWLEEWRFSKETRARLVHLAKHLAPLERLAHEDGVASRRFLRSVGRAALPDLGALVDAELGARNARGEEEPLRRAFAALQREEKAGAVLTLKELALHGGDLQKELGLPPGRWLGEVLQTLLERVTEEPDRNERGALLALARELAPQK